MADYSRFKNYVMLHRAAHDQHTDTSRHVISPVIQHSCLGAHGGLGDFVTQTSTLFPHIEWACPLTEKIREHIGDGLGPALAVIPVTLFDPVTAEQYQFDFELYCHRQENNSLAWLFYNRELMEPLAIYKSLLETDRSRSRSELNHLNRFYSALINQNSYQHTVWTFEHITIANTPEMARIHPLLRRYINNPDMLNAITQSAMSKAIVALMAEGGISYDVVWVHDWHFATIGGELLLPSNDRLAQDIHYVQHLHNALYQGICPTSEIIDILGWPDSHYSEELYKVHGQMNFLGGSLNTLRSDFLNGKAIAVSQNHATELTTAELGAGLHHIFEPLWKAGKLAGINNPVTAPQDLLIKNVQDIIHKKPLLKEMVQSHFELEVNPEAFLLLWSHRFTQQKQVTAVLHALETLLKDGFEDLQIAFFCDIHSGSNPDDVKKLESLIGRFPKNIATGAFDPHIELLVTAGVDGALMASYFEPFGYAPVWVGMQGGFIITGANGGQVDIFNEETAFFIDIRPDIDKPGYMNAAGWRGLYDLIFTTNDGYRKDVFEHNAASIEKGIRAARKEFGNNNKRLKIESATMKRIQKLTDTKCFSKEIRNKILLSSSLSTAKQSDREPKGNAMQAGSFTQHNRQRNSWFGTHSREVKHKPDVRNRKPPLQQGHWWCFENISRKWKSETGNRHI